MFNVVNVKFTRIKIVLDQILIDSRVYKRVVNIKIIINANNMFL